MIRFLTTFFMVGRHLVHAFGYSNHHELHSWGNAFVIPAFSFASGVFIANTDGTVVYRIWAFATLAVLLSLVTHIVSAIFLSYEAVSVRQVFFDRIAYYWFLPCLFLWRLALLPLFSAARARRVPLLVPFSLVFIACYFGRHFFMSLADGPATLVFIWNRAFAFAPFFAVGALLPKEGWRELISDIRLQVLGAIFFTVWHTLLIWQPWFRRLHIAACFDPTACEFHPMGGHFPLMGLYRPYSVLGLFRDVGIYVMMLPVTLAVIWLASGVVAIALPRVPFVVNVCAACGARALLALVLHVPLVEMASMMHVDEIMKMAPEALRTPLIGLFALQITLMLSSGGTIHLLGRLVNLGNKGA